MESNQIEVYQNNQEEPSDNPEKVILRTLVGDPNRHKPQVEHTPPSAIVSNDPLNSSMYTIEARNRKIPQRVLPKTVQVEVEYLAPEEVRPETPVKHTLMAVEEEPIKSIPDQRSAPKTEPQEHTEESPHFLEPEIIHEPVLYTIEAIETVSHQPLFYTIVGQSHSPHIVASPVIPKEVEKPIEPISPSFYTIVGKPATPAPAEEPIKPEPIVAQQDVPNFYTIVGSPKLASPVIEESKVETTPLIEPVNTDSTKPAPILFTIVANKKKPTHTLKEVRPPPPAPAPLPEPTKKKANPPTLYPVIGGPKVPTSRLVERKIQSLPPLKKQSKIPTLYAAIGKPKSTKTQDPSSPLKKSPASTESRSKLLSDSPEQETDPEVYFETMPLVKNYKQKREPRSQERKIPKSETIFIPIQKHEPIPRHKPTSMSPGRIRHTRCLIPNYDRFHGSNYMSPYAYHPSKPSREQSSNATSLPPLKSNSEHRTKAPTYETPSRGERKYLRDPWTPHSLERYPNDKNQHSRRWDYENHAQTDTDDDPNEQRISRLKHKYRRFRPRTPWVSVW